MNEGLDDGLPLSTVFEKEKGLKRKRVDKSGIYTCELYTRLVFIAILYRATTRNHNHLILIPFKSSLLFDSLDPSQLSQLVHSSTELILNDEVLYKVQFSSQRRWAEQCFLRCPPRGGVLLPWQSIRHSFLISLYALLLSISEP